MADIKVRVGQQNTVKVLASAYGGSLTAETARNVVGGIASVTQLGVSGVSTLTGPVGLGSDLNVAGISTFSGDINLATNKRLYVGTANTVSLWNNGAITRLTGEGNAVIAVDNANGFDIWDGATYSASFRPASHTSLYYAGTKRFQTAGTGVTVTGTVYSDQLIINSGVSTFNNGDVIFQGAAAGQNMTWDASENDLEFTDDARLKFGDSVDLEIWHSGNSHIKNSTGDLKIRSDSLILKRADDSEPYLKATVNEDVKLYYNGNEKFATISTGATVTGDLYVSGDLYIDDITLDHINGNTLNITGIATFGSDVSIGGTLTYEDVTNVDSVGIVTAGKGLRATTGGLVVTAGVSTFGADATVAGTLTAGLIDGGSY